MSAEKPSLFRVLWGRLIPLISGVALLSAFWFGSNSYYGGVFAGDEWIKAAAKNQVPQHIEMLKARGALRLSDLMRGYHRARDVELQDSASLVVRAGTGEETIVAGASFYESGGDAFRAISWDRGSRLYVLDTSVVLVSTGEMDGEQFALFEDITDAILSTIHDVSLVEVALFDSKGQVIRHSWKVDDGVAGTIDSTKNIHVGSPDDSGSWEQEGEYPILSGRGEVQLNAPYAGYVNYQASRGRRTQPVFFALIRVPGERGTDGFTVAVMVPEEVMLMYPKRSIFGGLAILMVMVALVMVAIQRVTRRHVLPLSVLADRVSALRTRLPAGGEITEDVDLHATAAPNFELESLERAVDGLEREVTRSAVLEHQLRTAQKLEVVGRLAGGIAHDFNNLLNVIGLNLAVLKRGEIGSREAAGALGLIHDATKIGTNLTRNLMQFCRGRPPGAMESEHAEVVEIVRRSGRLLDRLLEGLIELDLEIPSSPVWARVVDTELDQVLMNLLLNARDASALGGKVVVRVNVGGRPQKAPVDPAEPEHAWVCLTVQDQGDGISETDLERVFEPFFSTKEGVAGTGLGMSVVHEIVTHNGGYVDIASTLGQGTEVSVWLRHLEEPDEGSGFKVGHAPSGETTGETIAGVCLLVDDDAAVLESFSRVLTRMGLTVFEEGGPLAALKALETTFADQEIDIVISDIMMPGMDGYAFAERLHRVRPDVPVCLMSGQLGTAKERSQLSANVHCVLEKPVLEEELHRVLGPLLVQSSHNLR